MNELCFFLLTKIYVNCNYVFSQVVLKEFTSEFVECDDVNRLDFIFKLFDLLLDEVCRNLIIFHGGSNLNLEDAVGDGLLLPLGLPEQTVHFNTEDLLCELL